MTIIGRYGFWLPVIAFLLFSQKIAAGQSVLLPTSSSGVTLQTAYPGQFNFYLNTLTSISDPAVSAISGDNSQNWRITNFGGITGGNGSGASGVKIGAAVKSMSVVENYGQITTLATAINGPSGVQFTNGGAVYNHTGAVIQGPDGVHTDNGPILVENHGAIRGASGGGSAVYSGQGALLRNFAGGIISGNGIGINVNGYGTDVSIYNYGTISTAGKAIQLYNGNVYTAYNAPTGVISSDNSDGLHLEGKDGYLLNEGRINAHGNGVYSLNGFGDNAYVNTGTITAGASGMRLLDGGNVVYNLGTLSGNTNAVQFDSADNLLVLGSEAYLPRLDLTVRGPGSRLGGDAVSTVAGNDVLLTDSGSEDSRLTGFESLTMNGGEWSLSAPLSLGFGSAPGQLQVESGRLTLLGDLTAANNGRVMIAYGGTLSLHKGLVAASVNVAGGGMFEYAGTAGDFANTAINVDAGGTFRLSRLDSRLTLQNTVALNLAPGSFFGVTVGRERGDHSILYVPTFAPAEGVRLDINGHTPEAIGISALPAGDYEYQGVVRANNPVVIPSSMRLADNPLMNAALRADSANPNWADLDLVLRNINDVYGPHIEAADVWRLSSLPNAGQRRWLDNIYRSGLLDDESREFFQILDGHPILAVQNAWRSNIRNFHNRVGDRLRAIDDFRPGNSRTAAARAIESDGALAMPSPGPDCPWQPQYAVWADAGQRWSKQKDRDNILGYDYNPFGLTLGLDRIQGNWVLGLAAQYDNGDVKTGGTASTVTGIEGATGGLYAAYQTSRWYGEAGAQAGYGWNSESTRYHAWNQYASASYNTSLVAADAEFGAHFSLGDPARPFRITPHAGIDYGHLRQDGFAENGDSAIARSFSASSYDVLETPVGVRLSKTFLVRESVLAPYADLSYAHNFGDSAATGAANFVALPNQPWAVDGVDSGRDAFRLSAGMNARFGRRLEAGLSYDLEVRNKFTEHRARLGMALAF